VIEGPRCRSGRLCEVRNRFFGNDIKEFLICEEQLLYRETGMIVCGIVSFLIGSALGAELRVWILVPATMVALVLSVLFGWFTESSPLSIVVDWMASAVGLQMGYLCSALLSGSPKSNAHVKFANRARRAF
jgi:hypothetical protein